VDGKAVKTCRLHRVDEQYGNPFNAWLAMGSPKAPTPEQIRQLQAATATEADAPQLKTEGGNVRLNIRLPRQSVVLLEFTP
jgi:xylan 1,4-beta-xylosidase